MNDMKYWDSGTIFRGTSVSGNDFGSFKFWHDGTPNVLLFGTAATGFTSYPNFFFFF